MSSAAEKLGISQPALSRAIANLEDDLGFALFDRVRQRVHPNPQGLQFFTEAQRILAVYDQLPAIADEIRSRGEQSVRVVCLPRLAGSLMASAIGRFHRDWPNARVILDVQARRSIETWTVAGAFDFAVTSFPIEHEVLASRELFSATPVLLMPDSHKFSGRESLRISDLAREPLVALVDGTLLRGNLEDAFAKANVKPTIVAEVSDAIVAGRLVGQGVGLTVTDAVSASFFGPALTAIPILGVADFRFGIVWRMEQALSQRAESLVSLIQTEHALWSSKLPSLSKVSQPGTMQN